MNPARRTITVREHAWLGTEPVEPSLDRAQIDETAFDYLCRLSERFSKGGARLLQVEGRRRLKVDNHVGVVRTPCGTTIEILPKHHATGGTVTEARSLLRKMLLAQLNVSPREVGAADLQHFDAPLTEWVMQRFLRELDTLIQRGLRFDYLRTEDELPFLRGQLDMAAQLAQRPGKGHHFRVRHDLYLPDRPENRLLALALQRVRAATGDAENWRLAHELSFRMAEVPVSRQVAGDFRAWGRDRLMAHYRAVRPWCELILAEQMPLALAGDHEGLSLLYPMEKLFERYVACWLRERLGRDLDIRTPASSQSLCWHRSEPVFRLEPDIYVVGRSQRWILDAKWKLLDEHDREAKYGLSQADIYQLYAYGQKYLGGQGRMALVFPRHSRFTRPLEAFEFDESLGLEVLPFDLESDRILGMDRLGLPLP